MASKKYYPIDFQNLLNEQGYDFSLLLECLRTLYEEVDRLVEKTTSSLELPCHRGCSMCCHESVFLTSIEFFGVWDWAQKHIDPDMLEQIVQKGLSIYEEHRDLICSFDVPPPEGHVDHFFLAKELQFACPLLSEDGACQVYPMRELLARLFGGSFEPGGDVYGCHLVRSHLFGQKVTLLPVKSPVQQLNNLPFTDKRQVYPYYIHLFYGQEL